MILGIEKVYHGSRRFRNHLPKDKGCQHPATLTALTNTLPNYLDNHIPFFGSHIKERLDAAGTCGMTQLAQGLGLDLAHTLTGDVKLSPYLFQGAASTILDPEAQLQDLAFAVIQGF